MYDADIFNCISVVLLFICLLFCPLDNHSHKLICNLVEVLVQTIAIMAKFLPLLKKHVSVQRFGTIVWDH